VGLTAGIKAGVRTIGITTGTYTRRQLATVKPDTIIDNIAQLTKILGR
jgi:phosphoglycolate phosphatase-like HAD superfamily hydrolase